MITPAEVVEKEGSEVGISVGVEVMTGVGVTVLDTRVGEIVALGIEVEGDCVLRETGAFFEQAFNTSVTANKTGSKTFNPVLLIVISLPWSGLLILRIK
jgi:hypothetical protein